MTSMVTLMIALSVLTMEASSEPSVQCLASERSTHHGNPYLLTHINVLAQVIECTTTKEIWDNLHDRFTACSSASVKGAEGVIDFYNRTKALAQKLVAGGHCLSDLEFNTYLLGGLDSSFDPVVAALTIQAELLPSPQLLSHLLVHEAWLNQQAQSLQ
ncbi:hypothetical protein V2J09_003871 [Rumex salicifolius]